MKTAKKAEIIDALPDLDDGEQIVIEDTKRIRREKMPESDNEQVKQEFIDIESEDATDSHEYNFSDTSIAALLTDNPDDLANQFCTIHVRRKPDRMRDNFLTPCSSLLTLPAIQNVELTAERSDIEEIVRQQYGGGHYFFQVRFQNRLSRSWEASLADPPEAIAAARQEKLKQSSEPVTQTNQAANPFDQFLETLKKQRELQDLLFGEERRRLEAEIERLRQESQQKPAAAPQSDLALLLDAMQKTNNPGLIDFAREYLSGESREPQFGVWDFLKYVFDHKNELAPLVAGFLGSNNANQETLEELLRSNPPAATAEVERQLPVSKFRRLNQNENDTGNKDEAKTNE